MEKTYRVWLSNGKALLVNAQDEHQAKIQGLELAIKQGYIYVFTTKIEETKAIR